MSCVCLRKSRGSVVKGIPSVVVGLVVAVGASPAAAQSTASARAAADQQQQARYQVTQMERMLEGAVEHGATLVRDHFKAAVQAQSCVPENPENAHVRGFRLAGYGVFFDIEVPPLQGTFLLTLRNLDQNDLGLQSALKALKTHIDAAGDANLQQALRRLELQVGPAVAVSSTTAAPQGKDPRLAVGEPAVAPDDAASPDPILTDPEGAYRAEIQQQIMEAMLLYSVPLGLGPDEWLTVAARRHDERPLLAPADTDARTVIIRIRGGDLAAFQARQIAKEEALKRMEVRVF
jgi:hypothetical protein